MTQNLDLGKGSLVEAKLEDVKHLPVNGGLLGQYWQCAAAVRNMSGHCRLLWLTATVLDCMLSLHRGTGVTKHKFVKGFVIGTLPRPQGSGLLSCLSPIRKAHHCFCQVCHFLAQEH